MKITSTTTGAGSGTLRSRFLPALRNSGTANKLGFRAGQHPGGLSGRRSGPHAPWSHPHGNQGSLVRDCRLTACMGDHVPAFATELAPSALPSLPRRRTTASVEWASESLFLRSNFSVSKHSNFAVISDILALIRDSCPDLLPVLSSPSVVGNRF